MVFERLVMFVRYLSRAEVSCDQGPDADEYASVSADANLPTHTHTYIHVYESVCSYVCVDTTLHYTRPHHTTPHHTTPHHTTPHHTTPHHPTPHYTTLHYTITYQCIKVLLPALRLLLEPLPQHRYVACEAVIDVY
jgi:hypothetical protein